jgi:hypothetical protein
MYGKYKRTWEFSMILLMVIGRGGAVLIMIYACNQTARLNAGLLHTIIKIITKLYFYASFMKTSRPTESAQMPCTA